MLRHALMSFSVAALTVGAAIGSAEATPAALSAPSRVQGLGIPNDCSAGSESITSTGSLYYVGYGWGELGKYRTKQKPLPFQPRQLAATSIYSAGDFSRVRYLSIDTAGRPHLWKQDTNEYLSTGTFTMKRLSGSWKGTKALAASRKYIYRVSGTALYRYEIGSGGVPVRGRAVARSDYGSVKTLTADYSTPQADTLIATTTGGALRQIKVRRTSTGTTTTKTLRSNGFQNFRSFTAGGCWDRTWAGTYLGVTKSGGVYAYYDSDRTDARVSFKGGRVGSWSHRTY